MFPIPRVTKITHKLIVYNSLILNVFVYWRKISLVTLQQQQQQNKAFMSH